MNDNVNPEAQKSSVSAERLTDMRETIEQIWMLSRPAWQKYLDLSEEQRDAFAAYVLSDVGEDSILARLETFESDYFDSYGSWDEARDALMAFFDWDKALADADVRDGNDWSLTPLLTWNEDAVRKRLEEELRIVELDTGAIVVFHW